MFYGTYFVDVDNNGEFRIPEKFEDYMDKNPKYKVYYTVHTRKDYEKDPWLLCFVFESLDYYDDLELIYEGTVTEDKKLKVPDKYIDIMKGECLLLGNIHALELTIFPSEAFDPDEEELKLLQL